MSHIANIFGLLEKLESPAITVRQNRCALVRNRNAQCLKCAAACTSGCISFTNNELTVSPERCIGCGTCATVCPTCALEAHKPNDAELLQQFKMALCNNNGVCTVACTSFLNKTTELYDKQGVVEVTCLGRIEESLLVSLVSSGVAYTSSGTAHASTNTVTAYSATAPSPSNTANVPSATMPALSGTAHASSGTTLASSAAVPAPYNTAHASSTTTSASAATANPSSGTTCVQFVTALCEGCEHQTGFVALQEVLESTHTLLSAWGSTLEVAYVDALPSPQNETDKEEFDSSKRAFFSQVFAGAKTVVATSIDSPVGTSAETSPSAGVQQAEPRYLKVMADGTLPHFIPDRRERLLNALATLGGPDDVLVETRLWGHVEIDPVFCSSCQMCATFCPTGAIKKFVDDDGSFGVEHYPGDCVKCKCCTDICIERALTILDEVRAEDLLDGTVVRYEMAPRKNPHGHSHAILNSFKNLMQTDQVYER